MITIDLVPTDTLVRVPTPRYAYLPTSGAGAAVSGGRYNRPGVEAVYLSRDAQTALDEYRQTSEFLPAGTVASFHATARVVDLTQYQAGDPAGDGLWELWDTDWRDALFAQHIEPPTWLLGDMVLAAGHHGILFSSLKRRGGINVVLYPSTLGTDAPLECVDPDQRLPRDDSSWPSRT